MRRAGTAAVVVVLAAALAPPAYAAAVLKLPTGGRRASWVVQSTPAGTYVLTRAFSKGRPVTRHALVTTSGSVTPMPAPPEKLGVPLLYSSSDDGSGLCAGGMVRASPYVACFAGGAWVERRFTGADRTRELEDINRFGSSLYATLLDGDLGGLLGPHPERAKITAKLVRWDGTAWVPVIPAFSDSFAGWTAQVPCLVPGDPACAPLGALAALRSERFKLRAVSDSRWVADPRAVAVGKRDAVIGPVVSIGPRVAVPLSTHTPGKPDTIAVQTAGPDARRVRVAAFMGSYADGWLSVAGGRLWLSWTDYFYFDRKETRGMSVARAAPLDLATGAVGPATEVNAALFRDTPPKAAVEDVLGAPYGAYIERGTTQETLVLAPIAP